MPFTIVYAGTRQPLPEGMRVYGVEIGPDKLPKAGAFRCDVQRKGFAGVIGELGLPRGATPAGQLEPDPKSKYQVIAIPAAEDFGSPAEAYQALRRCPELTFADGRPWSRKLWNTLVFVSTLLLLYVAATFNLMTPSVHY